MTTADASARTETGRFVIPVPATLALLGIGLVPLLVLAKRRRT